MQGNTYRTIYLSLILTLLFVSCNKPKTKDESKKDQEENVLNDANGSEVADSEDSVVERRVLGDLDILIYSRAENAIATFIIIQVNSQEGKVLSKFEFLKSAGGEWDHTTSDYQFVSDSNFEITSENYQYFPGAGIDDPNGVEMEELLQFEDPYDIVDWNLEKKWAKQFAIGSDGKIDEVSSKRIHFQEEIDFLSRFDVLPKDRLRILRNAVFAKHNYRFKSEDLLQIFSKQSAYEPKLDNVDHLLTEVDKEIVTYIQKLEDRN